MKKLVLPLFALFLFSCGGEDSAEANTTEESGSETVENQEEETEESEEKSKRKSPRTQSTGEIDGIAVEVDYGSPYVKERTIWGELVPYDEVWRAGADEATAVTFGADVMFGDSEVAAGTYALFVKPKEQEDWQIILNEEWSKEEHDVWGAYDYDPTKDVARINVTPEVGENLEESLQYGITEAGIHFSWEYMSFTIPVSAK